MVSKNENCMAYICDHTYATLIKHNISPGKKGLLLILENQKLKPAHPYLIMFAICKLAYVFFSLSFTRYQRGSLSDSADNHADVGHYYSYRFEVFFRVTVPKIKASNSGISPRYCAREICSAIG